MGSGCGTVGMSMPRRSRDGGTRRICPLSIRAARGRTLPVHTCLKCCSTCIPPEDVLPGGTKPLDSVHPHRRDMPRTGCPNTAQRQCILSFSCFFLPSFRGSWNETYFMASFLDAAFSTFFLQDTPPRAPIQSHALPRHSRPAFYVAKLAITKRDIRQ